MLFGKKCQYCGKEYSGFKHTHCPYCDDIDFANIDSVTIMNTEMTYRIETEEESLTPADYDRWDGRTCIKFD